MSLARLQQIVRKAGYEPGRGLTNSDEMEMVQPGVRELAMRFLPGRRTFAAFADDGLVVALHFMEPGGDEEAVYDELARELAAYYVSGRMLKAV